MKLIALTFGVAVALSYIVDSSNGKPRYDMGLGQAEELHRATRLYEDRQALVQQPRERRLYHGVGRAALLSGLQVLEGQDELMDDLNEQAEERVRGTLGRGWQAVRNRFRSGTLDEDADDIEDEDENDEEE